MRRIIDGVAYNTETATAVKRVEFQIDGDVMVANIPVQTLYKTRYGAWFLHREDVDFGFLEFIDIIEPLSDDDAKAWLARFDTDLYEHHFGPAPEAGQDEAVIYVRVPRPLRVRVDAAVSQAGGSLNAWAIKVFEQAVDKATWRV